MELINIKTAAQLVQESPARIRHLITKKVIEVYPEKRSFFGDIKIIKSSLLAYYQKQLLREIREQVPSSNYQTMTYQHLMKRVHNLSNFKNNTHSSRAKLKKKRKSRNQSFAALLMLFWTVAGVGLILFLLKNGYLS